MDLRSASAQIRLRDASPEWAMRWLRLFSQRMSTEPVVNGSFEIEVVKAPIVPRAWSGTATCRCSLPLRPELKKNSVNGEAEIAPAARENWILSAVAGSEAAAGSQKEELALQVRAERKPAETPTVAMPADVRVAEATGRFTEAGYVLRFTSAALAHSAADLIPAMGDDLPTDLTGALQAQRRWGGRQAWEADGTATARAKHRPRRRR